MSMKRIPMPAIEGSHCFACGSRNPMGLSMSFYLFGDSVRSDLSLSSHHVGWENIAHGGIISTILDEIMGWSVITFKQVYSVTKSMEIRFLKPVPVQTPLTAIGRIIDENEGGTRDCRTRGMLVDSEGNRLAEGYGRMAILSPKRMHMISPQYRRDMDGFFDRIRALIAQNHP